jgi:hypothetical protein
MRRIYAVGTGLTFGSRTQINCVAITAHLAIIKDKAVLADTFFVYHVRDNGIHAVPAELLLSLVTGAITYHYYLASRIVAYT